MFESYDLKIIHNPEFLSVDTAEEDFHNQDHIVIGGNSKWVKKLVKFYKELYLDADFSLCSAKESESMKMMANTFYAIKIQTFSEYFLYCEQEGLDFEKVKLMILKNGFISPMHTNVPGMDGNISYGGTCLPKDSQALLHHFMKKHVPCSVINGCVTERNSIRQDWI